MAFSVRLECRISQWRNSYELYPVRAGGTRAIGLPGGILNRVVRRPFSFLHSVIYSCVFLYFAIYLHFQFK
jgi:hypothetical protein